MATYTLPSTPGATFVITNKASEAKQKKLVEIMNYIVSFEGHIPGEFGKEGENWVKPEAGDVALNPDLEPLFKTIASDQNNQSWGALVRYYSSAEFRGAQVQPMDIYTKDGYERRLFQATQEYEPYKSSVMFPYWNVWVPEADAADLATAQTNVESYVSTSAAEFITGARDISDDTAWQQYVDGLTGLNVDRYLEIWQQAYDASA